MVNTTPRASNNVILNRRLGGHNVITSVTRSSKSCSATGRTVGRKCSSMARLCGTYASYCGHKVFEHTNAIRTTLARSRLATRMVTSLYRLPLNILGLVCEYGNTSGVCLVASKLRCSTARAGRNALIVRGGNIPTVCRSNIVGLTSHSYVTKDMTAASELIEGVCGEIKMPLYSTMGVTSLAPTEMVNLSDGGNGVRGSFSTSLVVFSSSVGVSFIVMNKDIMGS